MPLLLSMLSGTTLSPVRSQRDRYLGVGGSWEVFLTHPLSHAWISPVVSSFLGTRDASDLTRNSALLLTVDCYLYHPSEVTMCTCIFWFFLLASKVIIFPNWFKVVAI